MRRVRSWMWFVIGMCLLVPAAVHAQGVDATILGSVSDPTNAVVPGATVDIQHRQQGWTRSVVTDEKGFYRAGNLPLGLYDLKVGALGFQTEVRTGIQLTVGSEVVVSFSLRLGERNEQVTVTGDAPQISTTTATMNHLVDERTVRELPINGRDWAQLAILQPGVLQNKAQQANDPRNSIQRGSGMQLSISGGRVVDNNFRVDGVNVNDFANAAPGSSLGANLGVDAIQEFSVLTGNFSAQFGRASGGVVNAVTRSGTNQWHASAYEFLRNSALDAANFFDNLARVSKPARRRNQFGGTFGGPLQKNKTFFFTNYEGIRSFTGTTRIAQVFSDAARSGNLVAGRVSIHPTIAPYLDFFPRVNVPGSIVGDVGFYAFPGDDVARENFWTLRLDRNFGAKDTVYGVYTRDVASGSQPDDLGTSVNRHGTGRHIVALSWNHIFSPVLLQNTRLGYSRSTGSNNFNDSLSPQITDQLSLGFVPGLFAGRISVSGITNFLGGTNALDYNLLNWNSYQAYEDLSWQRGKHALSFGFNYEAMENDSDSPGFRSGRYTFQSIRDFLTNATASGSRAVTFEAALPGTQDAFRGMRQKLFGAYLNDDFRLSSRMTWNLGVRWEATTTPFEIHGKLAALRTVFDRESTIGPLFSNPTWKYFSPRLGFAWDPWGDGKTAIRAGFAVYYVLPLTHLLQPINNRATPFFQSVVGDLPAGTPLPQGLQFSRPGTQRNAAVDYDAPASYRTQWNLNVQRQLSRNLAALVSYTGSRAVHLWLQEENVQQNIVFRNADGTYTATRTPMNANFGRIDWRRWAGDASYHGLQTGLTLRSTHGLQFQGSYTWSRMLDNGTPTNSNNEFRSFVFNPIPLDTSYNWGPSDYDVTHAFVFSGMWNAPEAVGSGFLRTVLGGWQLGSIISASQGIPFTVTINGDPANLGAGTRNKQRPVQVSGCTPLHPGSINYLDPACFGVPSPVTAFEKAITRNSLRGLGLMNVDFAVFKNMTVRSISESFRVQFRSEFFNLFNRTSFANPGARGLIDTAGRPIPSAGVLTGTFTPARQIQFGLKVMW